MTDTPARSLETRLVRLGADSQQCDGALCPPAQRGSTLLLDRSEDMYDPHVKTYGLAGLAAQDGLKRALCTVEDAKHCLLLPSGLFACTLPLLALGGRHVLVSDNVYGPTRRFCQRTLRRFGCETDFFDPAIGAGIDAMIRPDTGLIFLESPGSLTFEISDTPAIVDVARARGVRTAMDNTWSAGIHHKPLAMGVDISIQATTKYQAGHADTISGAVLTSDETVAARLCDTHADLGVAIGAEDAWLILRGMRTMMLRMRRSETSGLLLADWLKARSDIGVVLHPALPDSPSHHLWKRDFKGSAGLLSFTLPPSPPEGIHAFLNALSIFGLGFSWGGHSSLAIWCDPQLDGRTCSTHLPGPLIRLGIGLEDPGDLIADLENALAVLARVPA